jgi:hypothetical protein
LASDVAFGVLLSDPALGAADVSDLRLAAAVEDVRLE